MSAHPTVAIENLGKEYRLGGQDRRYRSLREDLMALVRHPFRRRRSRGDGQFWALRHATLDVGEGEVLGLIGRNGAGKSTLLKLLSRITRPSEGEARLAGRVGSLLEVGTGFHPELTGAENIYLSGAILGMRRSEIRQKYDEIVAFASIEEFLSTPVKHYSSGMYVRLGFAIAAHLEPEILLIDEVLAVGDNEFQKRCLGKLGDVARSGRTVIFVSHNMAAVQSLCDRAVLLDQGQVVADGPASEVCARYLNQSLVSGAEEGFHVVDAEVMAHQPREEMRIERIALVSGAPGASELRTGDSLTVRIEYDARQPTPSPAFFVSIHTLRGIEVIQLSTRPVSGFDLGQPEGRGAVELHIDALPLVSGTYFMDVRFSHERVEWIVRLDGVVRFQVQPGDVYGSGFALDESRGLTVVEHHWEHHARS